MTPPTDAIEEVRKRHEQALADIQNNFGAAYSTRIAQDKFSIHEDRATLLAALDARTQGVGTIEHRFNTLIDELSKRLGVTLDPTSSAPPELEILRIIRPVPSEEEIARVVEQAIHGVEWTAGKRPSIDELEKMLNADETPSIHILPDGSITAGEPRPEAFKCARAIRALLLGDSKEER